MPINRTKKGDLLAMFKDVASDIEVMVHGANCVQVMGGGIAGQIARDPTLKNLALVDELFELKDPMLRLGNFTFHAFIMKANQVRIGVNLYTQLYPARGSEVAVDYWAVGLGFKKLNSWLVERKATKVGIPMIGAGLANGDWNIISRVINDVTPDLDITLVEFQP